MEFGVPRRREVSSNKEKYANIAVITVSAFRGKGTARLLTLNKKAIEDLGLDLDQDAQVSFSFDKMHNSVSVANTTGLKNVSEVRVAKTSKSLSDKKYFEAIKENFNVNIEDEVELKLVDNNADFNGFKTFKLEKLLAGDVMTDTVNEAIAETIVVGAQEVSPVVDLDLEEVQTSTIEPVQEEDPLSGLAELEEAPIEYVQEQAEERDVFEAVLAEEQSAGTEEAIDSDNPFLSLEN